MDTEIEADFLRPGVRDLPLAYVQDWFFAAVETPFPVAIWCYLLPRVLEILAAGEDPASVAIEVTLSRYPTGDAAEWTPQQWAVLDAFQRALLPLRGKDALDDLLCMFVSAGWSADALEEQVMAFPDALLVERLWRDWGGGWATGFSIWQTSFWNGPATMHAFYLSDALYDRVSALGVDERTDPALAAKALDLATTIEQTRA